MLSKNFKSDKYYEVTRYWLKHGNEEDGLENTITVWDSLEKAKAYIERYNKGLKFESATVEEIIVNKVITMEDYKKNNFEIVSYQEVYSEDYDGNYDETLGKIYYLNGEKISDMKKGLKIVAEFNNINDEKEFFEEKKELVKSNIKDKTNFKPRYLTKKEYDETHQSFSSWARVGDIVDEQIVEEFRDCIFPVAYDAMYLQCGEPYKHGANPKTGKWEPAFITFARELGSWVYKGICFYREYEDVG